MRILRPEQAYAQQYFQYEEPLADTELEIERTLVRRTKEYKPNLDDFDDIYSLAEIDKDKERLAKQKEKEQKETHERALILEAILADQIEKSNWFGENCCTVLASNYDDRFSHTDLILEFNQKEKIVRLAVDITMAENPEILETKRTYIKEDIEKGQLTNLKYFASEIDPNIKGRILGIPRIIIGVDKGLIHKLSGMIVSKKTKKLAEDAIQLNLLKAIKSQLENEIKYAKLYFRKNIKKRISVANRHQEVLKIINQVLEQKEKALSKDSKLKENIDWSGDIKGLEYLFQKGY